MKPLSAVLLLRLFVTCKDRTKQKSGGEYSFPLGCQVMTGTGVVPENDCTLMSRDKIKNVTDNIGTRINTVQ